MIRFLFISFFVFSQNLLVEFGQAPAPDQIKPQQEFTLITWNIYKGGESGLYKDLQQLVLNADFVLMQEFLLNQEQEKLMQTESGTHWAFAKSFEDSGGWTGVATMSRWQPFESVPVRSPGTEPFVGTPKMSLISKYKMAEKDLWIVNLHALNFNIGHGAFKEQINDIVARLEPYKGGLIFAGDFNTWAFARREYLLQKTQGLGLTRVELENPMGVFSETLDHIFYRGVTVLEFRVMDEVQSSDHLPLRITFQ